MQAKDERKFLTIENLCKRYGVTRETIRRWRKFESFPNPAIKEGRTLRWREADLIQFEESGGPSEMVHHEKELQQLQAEVDIDWTPTAAKAMKDDDVSDASVLRQLKSTLGLPVDTSNGHLCGTVLDLQHKYRQSRQANILAARLLERAARILRKG